MKLKNFDELFLLILSAILYHGNKTTGKEIPKRRIQEPNLRSDMKEPVAAALP